MLMGAGNREARIHYLDGTFRLLSAGDHVRCAITGAIIPLDELRYWSVERQEAYIDAATSLEATARASHQAMTRTAIAAKPASSHCPWRLSCSSRP